MEEKTAREYKVIMRVGVKIHPHLFRHLDNKQQEGKKQITLITCTL